MIDLKRYGSVWDRNERINQNDNLDTIERIINDRGAEILSDSAFLNWLDENGVKHLGEWDDTKEYDSLSVVLHEGNSYTSKKQVPVGIDILNEEFWILTGNYNAQIEHYRDETNEKIKIIKNKHIYVEDYERIPPENSDSGRIQRAIDDGGTHAIIEFPGDTVYDITTTLKPKSFQTWKGEGTRLLGNHNNVGIHFEGTEQSSNSRVNMSGLMLLQFDIGIKLTTFNNPPNGSYYNNFTNMRIMNSRIGYQLSENSNINNIIGNNFQNIREVSIEIAQGAYKNNVIGNSFEGTEGSTAIKAHGSTNLVTGNYFEKLKIGIDVSKGVTTSNGNYFSTSVETDISDSNYILNVGHDKNDFYPNIQFGDLIFKATNAVLEIKETGSQKARFDIPMRIRNSRGGIELGYNKPQIALNDTSDDGKSFRIRSQNGEVQTRNIDEKILTKVTDDGIFYATKGIHPSRVATDKRPNNVEAGTMIIDATLEKIIWWNGAYWKDAMGNNV